jgi:hypothetical protein
MRSLADFLACSAHLACWKSYFVVLQNDGTFNELGYAANMLCAVYFWTKMQAEAALLCGEVPVGCVIVQRGASSLAAAAAAVTASSDASLSNADSSSSSSSVQSTSANTSVLQQQQQQQQRQSVATVTLPCELINATELSVADATAAADSASADAGIYANDVVATGHNETNLTRNVRACYQHSSTTCCEVRRTNI